MIKPKLFFDELAKLDVSFFAGVPDSLLKDFCAYLTDNTQSNNHFITSNEGAAIALATGYHLATRKIPMVYLQNSGLGNTINPLTSLADKEVYSIPMVLMIGWRGEPGVKDEPQHIKQGRIQNKILETLEIPYVIVDSETDLEKGSVSNLIRKAKVDSCPVAIVIKSGTFEKYSLINKDNTLKYTMSREDAIDIILNNIENNYLVVSTTGKASREVFEIRKNTLKNNQNDFLTVGSMGHASQIALGVALFTKDKVVCIDGDGAILMHMGSLAISGTSKANNLIHIVLNNSSHESVGGQPTVGGIINFTEIARSCCYDYCKKVTTKNELIEELNYIKKYNKKVFIEIMVNLSSRDNLSRPDKLPKENKNGFMKKIQDDE
jgi:phosphonopyruvate decarboxylase